MLTHVPRCRAPIVIRAALPAILRPVGQKSSTWLALCASAGGGAGRPVATYEDAAISGAVCPLIQGSCRLAGKFDQLVVAEHADRERRAVGRCRDALQASPIRSAVTLAEGENLQWLHVEVGAMNAVPQGLAACEEAKSRRTRRVVDSADGRRPSRRCAWYRSVRHFVHRPLTEFAAKKSGASLRRQRRWRRRPRSRNIPQ